MTDMLAIAAIVLTAAATDVPQETACCRLRTAEPTRAIGAGALAAPNAIVPRAEPRTALPAVEPQTTATLERMIRYGVVGGAVGWVGGALALGGPLAKANPFDSDQLDDGLWTPGIVIGFEVGQAIGIPLAVHLANGRQGNLRASLAASTALATLGTLLIWTDDFDAVLETPGRQAVLIAVPIAQFVAALHFERRGSR
jgi:hypothetical protein